MISHVRLVTAYVADQDKALDFYVNKLGFEVQADTTYGTGFRWVEVVPPGAETAITLVRPYPGQGDLLGKGGSIVFTTDDIQGTYEGLREQGVRFVEAPTLQPWGSMQAIFQDPDGNTFVLVDMP